MSYVLIAVPCVYLTYTFVPVLFINAGPFLTSSTQNIYDEFPSDPPHFTCRTLK